MEQVNVTWLLHAILSSTLLPSAVFGIIYFNESVDEMGRKLFDKIYRNIGNIGNVWVIIFEIDTSTLA